jgi:large subunit ribosomal protein L9
MKAAAEREAARLKGDAQKLASVLQSLNIKIVARAGESDQLFGSVTSRDIAAELEKQGYSLDRHKIFLDRPIRLVGDHEVIIHLHRDIDVKLLVKVRAEGREDEDISAKAAAAEAEVESAVVEETEVEAAEAEEAEPAEAETKPAKARGKSAKKSEGKKAKKREDEE